MVLQRQLAHHVASARDGVSGPQPPDGSSIDGPAAEGCMARILVVDDTEAIRLGLSLLLKRSGHEPVCAPGGPRRWPSSSGAARTWSCST
jgi:hypothetical protein